ncbi:hypothetical protein FQA39_LY13294 [Lamprigera yunnana]|nr:hypothetical protein FQA39_LY13294 [Lamprigera yunnana]
MYSIYEAESRPIATDGYSAVERMRRHFTALAFKTDHEIVYGLGRWHSEAYLQYLSHPVLYKKDLDAFNKIKLDAQDAAGYAVNDDEVRSLNEISKTIGEPEYWD